MVIVNFCSFRGTGNVHWKEENLGQGQMISNTWNGAEGSDNIA